MQRLDNLKRLILTASAFALVACGGDSGGGTSTPTPPPGGGGNTNQPPSINGPTEFTFAENQRVIFTVNITDPDSDTVTVTILPGGDGGLFTIDETTGEIFATDNFFNFEQPRDNNQDNVYEQDIELSDGSNTVSATITVTITNVIEPPQYSGENEFQIDENSTTGINLAVSDPDGREFSYNLSGDDAQQFSIENGFLSFNFDPDFESPADANDDNLYLVDVEISNDEATITEALSIEIVNVNEPPICTTNVNVEAAENTTGDILTFETSDPENDPHDFDINLSVSGDQAISDSLALDGSTGTVSLQTPLDFEALSASIADVSTTYGPSPCSFSLEVTDIDGIPVSGIVIKGSFDDAKEINDLDGDGINELWLRGDSTNSPGGFLFTGAALSDALPANALQITDGLQIRHSDNELQGHTGITYFNARTIEDIDGDGFPELMLWEDVSEGWPDGTAVYLIWGNSLQSRSDAIIVDEMDSTTGLELQFEDNNGSFTGSRVGLTTGDFDGDGVADVAIGLPDLLVDESDDGTGVIMESYGYVSVIFGEALAAAKSNGVIRTGPFSSSSNISLNLDLFYFESPGEQLETLKDIDGDGADELLMTWTSGVGVSFGSDIRAAKAGSDMAAIISNEFQTFRRTTSFNRRNFDLDGDLINDFIFTPESASELAVIGSGDIEPVASRSSIQIVSSEHAIASNGVTAMNDIDGDGLDDFVVGFMNSIESSPGNRVTLFTGQAMPAFADNADIQQSIDTLNAGAKLDLFSPVSNKTLNAKVSGFADLNGDNLDELWIVSEDADEVYLVLGNHLRDGLTSGETVIDLEVLLKNEAAAVANQ